MQPKMTLPLTIRRTFAAAPEHLYHLWTTPTELAAWFGPAGARVSASTFDLRVGGTYHFCIATDDGHEMWGKWTFTELMPGRSLAWRNAFSDRDGGLTRHPFAGNWPLEVQTNLTLAAVDGGTELSLILEPIAPSTAEAETFDGAHASMQTGWDGTFAQLDAYLARG
jgi:uncharacterized protein YndB with AHSA1/START domain